ncbi:arabinofuranosidase catalytic domain-containing protein [Actinospica robiniae]|uniref:arabinofuranosidase catalytic domain-containing protein n=1 Tax=Actinospica robiniae TaxID=304901 RepID=UPI0005519CFB
MLRRNPRAGQRLRTTLLSAVGVLVLGAGVLFGASGVAQAATSEPCDIYASAGTPCVAAHSTTRALFAAYSGALYEVKRASDGSSTAIYPVSAGSYANASTQNSFCSGTICTITEIFDQSGHGNTLTIEGPGGYGGQNVGAIANALPVTVDGHTVYGVYVSAGVGYRDNSTSSVPTGSAAQGAYMVTSGTHYNNRCCFDYGNAETSSTDTGNGHMDAINFGSECWFSPCSGSGPWVQADLENGLFAGGNGSDTSNKGNSSAFVTALVKDNGTNTYAIKGGNSQSGSLTTWYSGSLPTTGGYEPMHQEGAIILGTGGDDSDGSVGSFFEGVITKGYPTDAADNSVQSNVVAAAYKAQSVSISSGTQYKVTSVNAGTVMDDTNCVKTNGTAVDLWASLGNTCQEWVFTSVGANIYTVKNVNSGTMLDATNCSWTDGTAVDLWASLGNTCQEWQVIPDGSYYSLVNVNSGMVLDAVNCGTANGTKVDEWQALNNFCQDWKIAS